MDEPMGSSLLGWVGLDMEHSLGWMGTWFIRELRWLMEYLAWESISDGMALRKRCIFRSLLTRRNCSVAYCINV
jgi:hypothetical protein